MANLKSRKSFRAIIRITGINPYVSVPAAVSRSFGIRGNIPVRAKIDGYFFPATLVPVGGGRHRLYLHGGMRKKAEAEVGDRVAIDLTYDSRSRMPPIPKALAKFLKTAEYKKTWNGLTPSRRKEILRYLGFLKSEVSLKRNVEKVLCFLRKEGTWFKYKIP